MVKEVIWTPEAELSFDRVIQYLHENWTEKEIEKFIRATGDVITFWDTRQNPKKKKY